MVEFKNIEIKYGDFVAIKDLNLKLKEGEFFTFLGPSGCGKSTTLRALVGFINPSNGQIIVDGKDVSHESVEKREIGMVFQSYALFPTMTAYENIAFGLKVKKLSENEIKNKVMEVAGKIKINEKQLYRNISELSGGQQQRVALARAIVLEPKILCLDEPLSNLDAKLRVELRHELKRLQKELGITTLYVTHDQEEALTLSDRIAVFNNGFIEQIGTSYEVYNNSASEFVCDFIGDINRLGKEVIKNINSQTESELNEESTGYMRNERIHLSDNLDYACFDAVVCDYEYYGTLTKYIVKVMDQELKLISKNDGKDIQKLGSKIKIYINPNDVMQF